MRAAGSVVVDGDLIGRAAERRRCESDLNSAVPPAGRQQRTAIVRSGETGSRLDARDEQSCAAGIDERHILGIAGGVKSLIAEVELLRRDRHPGGVSRADFGNEGITVCPRS